MGGKQECLSELSLKNDSWDENRMIYLIASHIIVGIIASIPLPPALAGGAQAQANLHTPVFCCSTVSARNIQQLMEIPAGH